MIAATKAMIMIATIVAINAVGDSVEGDIVGLGEFESAGVVVGWGVVVGEVVVDVEGDKLGCCVFWAVEVGLGEAVAVGEDDVKVLVVVVGVGEVERVVVGEGMVEVLVVGEGDGEVLEIGVVLNERLFDSAANLKLAIFATCCV